MPSPRSMLGSVSIMVTIAASQTGAAPIQWSGNGHSYEAVSVPGSITWDQASAMATAMGGYLATITSEAENSFVFSLIDSSAFWWASSGVDYIGPWIGGFQPAGSPEPDGNWQWVTGEPFVFSAWNPVTNEPNNQGGNEDRIFFYNAYNLQRTDRWNDFPGGTPLPRSLVVETAPGPGAGLVMTLGAAILAHPRRRQRRVRAD